MMTDKLAADDFDGEPEEEVEEEEEAVAIGEVDESDNVGDPSVEINVEELIHELEADGLVSLIEKEKTTRRRLEELMERKRARRELEDFEDYQI